MERPNVLIFMCDQLNSHVLSCYGGPVQTPNIDRLAREGVRFTNATCPMPVCSPSRASFALGRYPHNHGIIHNVVKAEPPFCQNISWPKDEKGITNDDITTEKICYENGFQTHHYGKWHLFEEELDYYPDLYEDHDFMREVQDLFDTVKKERSRDDYMDWYGYILPTTQYPPYRDAFAAVTARWDDDYFDKLYGVNFRDFIGKIGRLDCPVEKTFDYNVASKVIGRLNQLDPGKPFFLSCSLINPHDPNVVPSPYYDEFDPQEITLPGNFESRESRYEEEWSRQMISQTGEVAAREFIRVYYGQVRMVDDQVGRVLTTLDQSGRAENTLIVFIADHGDMAGEHGMFWKSTSAFYEALVNIPLIIHYPEKLRAAVSDLHVSVVDMMPTLLDALGLEPPADIDGESFWPVLRGEKAADTWRQSTLCERPPIHPRSQRETVTDTPGDYMVRSSEWKYIRYRDGEEMLFHLAEDPEETVNLADDERYVQQKKACLADLNIHLERSHSRVPVGKA